MMKGLEWKDILTVLIGGLVGLLPIIMSSVLAWLDKRSLSAKKHHALELAKSRIDFIDRWVKVQQDVTSAERFEQIKRETTSELDQLKTELSEILVEEQKPEPEKENGKNLLKRLLLLYRPRNFSGWITHIVFYIVLFFTVNTLIGYRPGFDLATNEFSWSLLGSDLIVVLILFIPALIIRAIAIRIDRKAEQSFITPTVSTVIETA
jgi:hypothetical protein